MKYKNLLLIIITSGIIFGFSIFGIVKSPNQYSLSERRVLAQCPELTAEGVLSGKYMSDFEDYTLDQFPLRDWFRSLKAKSSLYIFRQKENHGLYTVDGYLSKLEYPLNEGKLDINSKKLQEIYKKYLADTDCTTYLSIIPDKNYFLAPLDGYPTMDYDALVKKLRNDLSFASYIDIFDKLKLSDYYTTDQHWRQEKIVDVAEALANGMNAEIYTSFKDNELKDVPFYGAYCGQAALNFDADTIYYLTNSDLDACKVTSYSTGKPSDSYMYDMEKAKGKDPYEIFLCGSEPLLVIENPNATEEKELVIFRDSFGSSITPLLTSGYSKITLVDLRYIRSDLLGSFIEFTDQDVLFLYSTLVLNNTISM